MTGPGGSPAGVPAPEPAEGSGRRTGAAARGRAGRLASIAARGPARSGTAASLVKGIVRRDRVDDAPGTTLRLLVLSCHVEDTIGVDVASGALVRLRVPWPEGQEPDLSPFDLVEAVLAADPQHDDLAQPEAMTAQGLPRQLGTLRGRPVKKLLSSLVTPPEDHVLGFPGSAAPYWEFRGFHPSLALLVPAKGPFVLRRPGDEGVWTRFSWERTDNWLPLEDPNAVRVFTAARRETLSGKDLASALGFKPHYVLASLTLPRAGHCYKTVRAILPRA